MKGFIYCLYDFKNGLTRIGKTKNSDKSRQGMQIGYYPFKLLEFTVKVDEYSNVETELHRHFKDEKYNADWYKVKPNHILNYIIQNFNYESIDMSSPISIFKALSSN